MSTQTRTTQLVDTAWLEQVQSLLKDVVSSAKIITADDERKPFCDRCGRNQSHPGDQRHWSGCIIHRAAQLDLQITTTPPAPDTTIQQEVVYAIRGRHTVPDAVTVTPGLVVTQPGGRTHVVLPHGTSFVFFPDEIQTTPPGHWI